MAKPPRELHANDLKNHDAIIHLAALADAFSESESEIFEINQSLTEHIVESALQAEVPNVVLFSSIKAVSEFSIANNTYPVPVTPYGRSKLAAEQSAKTLLNSSAINLFVLRPAPVYGLPISGNFERLERIVRLGLPLPFGSLTAEKSYLFLGNLIDFVVTLLNGKIDPGTYNLSDKERLTLPDLLRLIGLANGRTLRLFKFSLPLLTPVARLLPNAYVNLLLSDSIVEENIAQKQNRWQPPFTAREGIAQSFGNWIKP